MVGQEQHGDIQGGTGLSGGVSHVNEMETTRRYGERWWNEKVHMVIKGKNEANKTQETSGRQEDRES